MNQPNSKRAALVLGSIGLAAIFAFAWQARPAPRLAEFALPQTQVVPLPDQQVPVFESRFASSSFRNFAHASAISALRSEEHTSELQSRENLVCRLLLEKKKTM